MSYFTRHRMPWIFTGVLTLLNLALVATLWFRPAGPPHGPPVPDDYFREVLDLNSGQQEQFDRAREAHHRAIRSLQEQGRAARENLHRLLTIPEPDLGEADRLAQSVGEVQTGIERATFRHFHELRSYLRSEQLPKFDEVIGKVLRRGIGKRPE